MQQIRGVVFFSFLDYLSADKKSGALILVAASISCISLGVMILKSFKREL